MTPMGHFGTMMTRKTRASRITRGLGHMGELRDQGQGTRGRKPGAGHQGN